MIDIFTKAQFEAALPVDALTGEKLWSAKGLVGGEWTYRVLIDDVVSIEVRSSVRDNGTSAAAGQDSIRAWLVFSETGKPLGSKVNRWTTRKPGWEERLTTVLRTLWGWRKRAGNCKVCGKPNMIFKSRTPANPDRIFAKCKEHGGFQWLDEPLPSAPATRDPDPEPPAKPVDSPAQEDLIDGLLGGDKAAPSELTHTERPELEPVKVQQPERELNPEQQEAIDASVDGAVRVLAPPGSGKTLVIAHRYTKMLADGIDPADILAVTFSRTMANELLERIVELNPEVLGTKAENQICTIHAACYRILKAEGDRRNVAKFWQVKSLLQEIAEEVWQPAEERPGWDEILGWIDAAKAHAKSSENDLAFFKGALGGYHGNNLHTARVKYDKEMEKKRLLTFSDMLYEVEQRIMSDAAFRDKLQEKYKHCIIDEAQDLSEQAMRILITFSFEPGNNPVYAGD